MKTNAGFDFLAPVYDWIARLVFGKAITDSQTFFLNRIPQQADVLILGGGTGWLLEKISEQNKSCRIVYVDLSQQMIEKSKLRTTKDEVSFVQGTISDVPMDAKFDVVITNFYLDLFSDRKLELILEQIGIHVKPTSCGPAVTLTVVVMRASMTGLISVSDFA